MTILFLIALACVATYFLSKMFPKLGAWQLGMVGGGIVFAVGATIVLVWAP